MSILQIFLFLIIFGCVIYYLINLLIKKRMTESFTVDPNRVFDINDSHYFLTTSILPGKKDIANLKETNPCHTNYYYVNDKETVIEQTDPNVVVHRVSKLSYPHIKKQLTCISEQDPVSYAVKQYQPYMYNRPEIINYYDFPFYRDWRYPEQPIDVRFAVNPQKFCALNPQVYPCYKYYSKW